MTRLWTTRTVGAVEALRLMVGAHLHTRGGIVLAYHDVGFDPANRTDYFISPIQLRNQLHWARDWGLRFVDLVEFSGNVAEGHSVDGLAAVVFDDSLVGVHHYAMPVLLELGIPATVFTVSDELGESPPWWPGAARVMTDGELAEMVQAGFRVASHSRTHASLPGLNGPRLSREVSGSRAVLEDLVQQDVDLFAYPFGHFDRRVVDAVADAGYRAAYSFLNGRVVPGLDLYRLPRLNMWPGQRRFRLAYHLARPAASWPDTQVPEASGPQALP